MRIDNIKLKNLDSLTLTSLENVTYVSVRIQPSSIEGWRSSLSEQIGTPFGCAYILTWSNVNSTIIFKEFIEIDFQKKLFKYIPYEGTYLSELLKDRFDLLVTIEVD